MSEPGCPFCAIAADRVFHGDKWILAIWDAFAVSPGHALIIPKRHVESWFEASVEERSAMVGAIDVVRAAIREQHQPDGFNIGINDGPAAGQTIPHLHLHVIPRYAGDVVDPRGGIRHVIPGKAAYWTDQPRKAEAAAGSDRPSALVRGEDDPLLPYLVGHLDRASHVQIAVAFILLSGVDELDPHLRDLLARGGMAQILTGDYLDVSDPDGLQRLLDLKEQAGVGDRLALRVFEAHDRSFHPKAYIFHDLQGPSVAYVGSSNLTAAALRGGVEWNYRIIPSRDREGLREVEQQFRALWAHANTRELTQDWLDRYRTRRQRQIAPVAVPEEPPPEPPEPHQIQREALEALAATRNAGNSAGLVVLATGLGKTWLSAFDSHRPEFRRVLFVAHREEILAQAMSTFRRIRTEAHLGKYTGQEKVPAADVLFASIQTLGRVPHLNQFQRDAFDYIIVDEFHHAAARTYRRLIDYFEPKFLLGLTATPERTDGGDLLALCQENLVYRRDLGEGIRQGLLCPFKYFGVPDDVDYSNIPWRSTRFDEEALTQAVATLRRAENALEHYRKRAGRCTLAFCCSTRHADFMAEFFVERGVQAVAVHSGPTSAPRASSLERLQAGELEVVFAVDMFNEGVDLPNVDTILMLRPTESRVLWLQQFGRGLRVAPAKEHVTVIDYIGNHRVFLIKPQTLFELGSGDAEVARALEQLQSGRLDLPPGCEVTYELAAVDILKALLRLRGPDDALTLFYDTFKDRNGERPSATECFHEGYLPRAARRSHGSWFSFVRSRGDLSLLQQRALDHVGEFLAALETTQMTRSYKMLVLQAMLNRDALPGKIRIGELAEEFGKIAGRSARLREDVGSVLGDPAELRQLIERNPIEAWVGGKGTGGRSFFRYSGDEFELGLPVSAEVREAFQELTRELVDWRLAEYLVRDQLPPEAFSAKVSHASGRPILFLPDRETHPELPYGWTPVEANGESFEVNFVKVAVNVARRGGSESEENVLPEILYGWFGEDAGRPGTNFQVLFERSEHGYVARPDRRPADTLDLEVGRSYGRKDVASRFAEKGESPKWRTGFVVLDGTIILFVTLKKEGQPEQYAYRDRFLAAEVFEWQSQNRATQKGRDGQRIRNHEERGIDVQLFVRQSAKSEGRAAPFVYCGRVRFRAWEGEKPITVRWELETPLSEGLRRHFLEGQ